MLILYALAAVGAVVVFPSLLVWLYRLLLSPQNLSRRYNASFAFVTGFSSGLGFAIAERLAEEKVGLVLVSFPDEIFEHAVLSLRTRYPGLYIDAVGCDLADPAGSYINPVASALLRTPVYPSLCFLCAGATASAVYPAFTPHEVLRAAALNAAAPAALASLWVRGLLHAHHSVAALVGALTPRTSPSRRDRRAQSVASPGSPSTSPPLSPLGGRWRAVGKMGGPPSPQLSPRPTPDASQSPTTPLSAEPSAEGGVGSGGVRGTHSSQHPLEGSLEGTGHNVVQSVVPHRACDGSGSRDDADVAASAPPHSTTTRRSTTTPVPFPPLPRVVGGVTHRTQAAVVGGCGPCDESMEAGGCAPPRPPLTVAAVGAFLSAVRACGVWVWAALVEWGLVSRTPRGPFSFLGGEVRTVKKRTARGALVLVSSCLAWSPAVPVNATYGAGKKYMAAVGDALTAELHGVVDVVTAYPPPLTTRFWAVVPDTPVTRFVRSVAIGPASTVESIWRAAGRTHTATAGWVGWVCVAVALLPLDAVWELFRRVFHWTTDFSAVSQHRPWKALTPTTPAGEGVKACGEKEEREVEGK